MIHPFAAAVADFVHANGGDLLLPDSRVVVALSGGPDSCALLLALCEATDAGLLPTGNRPVACAHFHHGLRAGDADSEAAFCAKLCADLGVPCVVELGDVPMKKRSPQASARQVRYAFLADVAREFEADRVAVAHQADDVAETVLLRILRGASVDGLVGIPKRRVLSPTLTLIRPILFARRSEVEAYCRDKGVAFRRDPSNQNARYTRSRLRTALPEIAQSFNPKLVEALNRLAEHAREDSALLGQQARAVAREHVRAEGTTLILAYSLGEVPVALRRRVLIRALRHALRLPTTTGVSASASDEAHSEMETARVVGVLDELLRTRAGVLDLPCGLRARAVPDGVQLAPHNRNSAEEILPKHPAVSLVVPGQTALGEAVLVAEWRDAPIPPGERRARSSFAEFGGTIAQDIWTGNLTLVARTARIGDRLAPLGMDGRTKLLRDMMREARWTIQAREAALVVARADNDTPLWVIGLAQSDGTRVLDADTRVLFLNLADHPPTNERNEL